MTYETTRNLLFSAALGLGALLAPACAQLDDSGPTAEELATHQMLQPVFVEPVFVVDGLDELPRGMRLENLRLGVGAIFMDLIEDETGVAYANQDPFLLDFDLASGLDSAYAPVMQLPRGGAYEVSVQLEPQQLVDGNPDLIIATASAEVGEESSLVISGFVEETIYIPEDDGTFDEPVPLPWHPTATELRREYRRTPFSYASGRTVRFSVDEVTLTGGSRINLVMHVDVGGWVQETVRPALDEVLVERRSLAAIPGSGQQDEEGYIELHDAIGELGGEDALIGGMDIEIR